MLLVGCTTVKITDKNGSIAVTREIGVVNISASPEDGAVYADLSVLGYAKTPLGQVLGYSKQSVAVISEKCKLILWIDNSTNLPAVKKFLSENESICIIDSNKQKENRYED